MDKGDIVANGARVSLLFNVDFKDLSNDRFEKNILPKLISNGWYVKYQEILEICCLIRKMMEYSNVFRIRKLKNNWNIESFFLGQRVMKNI